MFLLFFFFFFFQKGNPKERGSPIHCLFLTCCDGQSSQSWQPRTGSGSAAQWQGPCLPQCTPAGELSWLVPSTLIEDVGTPSGTWPTAPNGGFSSDNPDSTAWQLRGRLGCHFPTLECQGLGGSRLQLPEPSPCRWGLKASCSCHPLELETQMELWVRLPSDPAQAIAGIGGVPQKVGDPFVSVCLPNK